ncbi:MAG: methionyl-tRNA formyltransferase [Anaerolineae bacterium]
MANHQHRNRLSSRIVFMGSPEFAVPSLRVLAGRFNVVAVVTQPDRPAGRGRQLSPPPVKRVAVELGLPVWQPDSLRREEAVEYLRSFQPDCVVVAAYGEILRPPVLAVPAKGCLNVHASLLPKYRGASPISAAILAGEQETGVTIMLLDAGMDTGPILAQERLPILPEDTRASLEGKLAMLGADLLVRTLPGWLAGSLTPVPQDDSQATLSRALAREDGRIVWSQPAPYIERQCRAMDPWPGAYTYWQGKLLKVWRGRVIGAVAAAQPGTVLRTDQGIAVATGDGLLRLLSIQPEGRGPMKAEDFARGRPQFIGALLT